MSKSSRRSNVNAREPMAQSSTAELRSYHVGALPIINHFLEKLDLQGILETHLPRESGRVRIDAPRAVLVLARNLLLSREPARKGPPTSRRMTIRWVLSLGSLRCPHCGPRIAIPGRRRWVAPLPPARKAEVIFRAFLDHSSESLAVC